MIEKSQKTETNLKKLATNAAKLVFFGNRNTRVIIQVMLASSCMREYYENLMQNEAKLCNKTL